MCRDMVIDALQVRSVDLTNLVVLALCACATRSMQSRDPAARNQRGLAGCQGSVAEHARTNAHLAQEPAGLRYTALPICSIGQRRRP